MLSKWWNVSTKPAQTYKEQHWGCLSVWALWWVVVYIMDLHQQCSKCHKMEHIGTFEAPRCFLPCLQKSLWLHLIKFTIS
jgi:hypothetical protein